MTAYLVLARPGAPTPDERCVVIADRFAVLAFIAPVIWLLFNRLWLEAFAAALVTVAASMLASVPGQMVPALAIGLALTLIHLITIPVTNTAVNPARSISQALFVGDWALAQLWLFVLIPILAAMAAGLLYKYLGKD